MRRIAAGKLHAAGIQRVHGEQRRRRGALVVDRAAGVGAPVADIEAERIALPAVARGDDVKMRHDADQFVALPRLRVHGVARVVVRFKSVFFGDRKRLIQHAAAPFAVGRVFARFFAGHRRHGTQTAQNAEEFFAVFFDIVVQFLIRLRHKRNLPSHLFL